VSSATWGYVPFKRFGDTLGIFFGIRERANFVSPNNVIEG